MANKKNQTKPKPQPKPKLIECAICGKKVEKGCRFHAFCWDNPKSIFNIM